MLIVNTFSWETVKCQTPQAERSGHSQRSLVPGCTSSDQSLRAADPLNCCPYWSFSAARDNGKAQSSSTGQLGAYTTQMWRGTTGWESRNFILDFKDRDRNAHFGFRKRSDTDPRGGSQTRVLMLQGEKYLLPHTNADRDAYEGVGIGKQHLTAPISIPSEMPSSCLCSSSRSRHRDTLTCFLRFWEIERKRRKDRGREKEKEGEKKRGSSTYLQIDPICTAVWHCRYIVESHVEVSQVSPLPHRLFQVADAVVIHDALLHTTQSDPCYTRVYNPTTRVYNPR